ncbi:MAG: DUF3126 family protein [Rhizomicrobium sp.]
MPVETAPNGRAASGARGRAVVRRAVDKEISLTRSEIWRLEKYLRNLFRLDTITVVERPKQTDSVEVHVNGEFIGVIFKDEEDGETSYAFNMAILEMDLPPAPASRN